MEEQLGSEGGSSSEDQFSETELGIEELQLALRAMQFRRFVTMVMNNVLFKSPCKGGTLVLVFQGILPDNVFLSYAGSAFFRD